MRPKVVSIPSGKFTLMPAGCIHYPIGEKDLLAAFVQRASSIPDARVVLMGDTCDFARGAYRSFLKSYVSDGTSPGPVEGHAELVAEQAAEILAPIKDRIDGMLLGNHFFVFKDGVNTEQRIAGKLGVDYLGPTMFLRYELGPPKDKVSVSIFGVHKFGGSTTPTGSVGALLRQERVAHADIVLSSHSHDRLVVPLESLDIIGSGTPHVGHRTRLLVKTGAFLKTYKEEGVIPTDKPHGTGYGEGAFRPTSLGWIEIEVSVRTNSHGIKLPAYRFSGNA